MSALRLLGGAHPNWKKVQQALYAIDRQVRQRGRRLIGLIRPSSERAATAGSLDIKRAILEFMRCPRSELAVGTTSPGADLATGVP